MTELFEHISKEVKDAAEVLWNLAMSQKDPIKAADFLNNSVNYYKNIYTDEEIEFLQFYFNMKMEMMKQ